ncbi:hypothetical protein C8R44DRAFT_302252 [Mycena epipterygia]|nr:hypothetical protein C8R44DRAFT_302252 [Mycena epipterygia]
MEILLHTPHLETLSVFLNHFQGIASPIPVRLAYLHTLTFRENETNIDLLDHLTLPALAHLELAVFETRVLHKLTAFLARSACSLRSISMKNMLDAWPVVACLRALPTVQVVRVMDTDWSGRQLSQFFSLIAHEAGFLPHLQSISLDLCSMAVEIPYADVAEMLASRWQGRGNGSPRMESFELVLGENRVWQPPIEIAQVEHALQKLQELADDGLKINIRGLQKIRGMVDAAALCPPSLHISE